MPLSRKTESRTIDDEEKKRNAFERTNSPLTPRGSWTEPRSSSKIVAMVSHPVILQGKSSPQAILRNQQATNERTNERTKRRLNNSRTTFVRSPYPWSIFWLGPTFTHGQTHNSLAKADNSRNNRSCPVPPERRNTGVKFYVRLSRSRTVSETGSRTAGPVATEILPRGSILSRNIRLLEARTPTEEQQRVHTGEGDVGAKTNEPRGDSSEPGLRSGAGDVPSGYWKRVSGARHGEAIRSTCTLDKRRAATVQPATATVYGEEREKRKTGKTEWESGPGRRQAAAACYCRRVSWIVESSGDIERAISVVGGCWSDPTMEDDDDEFGGEPCWSRESDLVWPRGTVSDERSANDVFAVCCTLNENAKSRRTTNDERQTETERKVAADWRAGKRDGTTRYDRFVRSPKTKRFVANGAHLSFRGSLRMSLRRKPTACHRCSRISIRDGSQVGEERATHTAHHRAKGGGNVLQLWIKFFPALYACSSAHDLSILSSCLLGLVYRIFLSPPPVGRFIPPYRDFCNTSGGGKNEKKIRKIFLQRFTCLYGERLFWKNVVWQCRSPKWIFSETNRRVERVLLA